MTEEIKRGRYTWRGGILARFPDGQVRAVNVRFNRNTMTLVPSRFGRMVARAVMHRPDDNKCTVIGSLRHVGTELIFEPSNMRIWESTIAYRRYAQYKSDGAAAGRILREAGMAGLAKYLRSKMQL